MERRGDAFFRAIRHPLRPQLISWAFIQPLEPKLDRLSLSVSRDAISDLHPADIAYILEALPLDERLYIWDLVKAERDGEILLEVSDAVRESLISSMDTEELVAATETLEADEIAELAPDLPQDFPPLQSLNAIPNNLPVQLTSFIGREIDITEVKRLLSVSRLVTLTGSGGAGKSRGKGLSF